MTRFVVTDKVPCWVTWSYHVEAETAEDAVEAYLAGEAEDEGHGEPIIGDTIGWTSIKATRSRDTIPKRKSRNWPHD